MSYKKSDIINLIASGVLTITPITARGADSQKDANKWFDLGVYYGLRSIGLEAESGTQTNASPQVPGGGPGTPFIPTTTTKVDVGALNRNNDFEATTQYVVLEGKVHPLNWLYLRGQVGGAMTDFNIHNKQGFPDMESSGTDPIWGAGIGGVIPYVQLADGKVRPVWDFLYTQVDSKDRDIRNMPGAKESLEQRNLAVRLGAEIDLDKLVLEGGVVDNQYTGIREAKDGLGNSSDVRFGEKDSLSGFFGAKWKLNDTDRLKFQLEANRNDYFFGVSYIKRFGGKGR